jgi:hypothetical protein
VQQKHPNTCNQLQEKQEQQDASYVSERCEGEIEENISTFDQYRASFHSMDQKKMEYTREEGFALASYCFLHSHTAESVEKVLYCLIEFNSTAVCIVTITTVTIISMIHRIVITMAIIVVLLFLFNRMMNAISMMENFDTNAISPQEVSMLFESINTVAW